MDDADGWHRVELTVDADDAELAGDVLWQAGAAAIEEQEATSGDRVVLLAGFESRRLADQAAAQADAAGHGPATVAAVVDDGADAWRAWAEPVRAGRWWITPTWVPAPAAAGPDDVVWIDPGRTFGSGSHATTRLCLALLDGLVAPGDRVLDVGCGSGVLAVGAARRGAEVVAIDIDPDAPAVTAANAARNGVAALVTSSTDALATVAAAGPPFDVVVGNLLAPVVAELGADLVHAVADDGVLVVSGLLADRWQDAMPALDPLQPMEVVDDDGWAAVVLRRR